MIRWLATSALAAGAASSAAAAELDDAIAVASVKPDADAPIELDGAPAAPPPEERRLDVATVIAATRPDRDAPAAGFSDAIALTRKLAQSVSNAPPPPALRDGAPPAPPAEDTVLFEADEVTRADETSPIVATGTVRAYSGGRYLLADRLSFDPATEIVVAEGNVSITDVVGGTSRTAFAGKVQLTGDLRDGVAEHFSALLEQNSKLAGYDAVREQGARTRIRKGVYTACDVCDSEGDGKTPTWRIKALRVTRDEERKVVRFRHALFEIKGVPIFYLPYLQAADPTLERASGFLTPFIGTSSRLGFNFELPYYLAFSNHTDATFSPKYTSRDGVLWQGEWRQRGRHGGHVLQAGVIDFDTTKPDSTGALPVGIPGVRWHIFGAGHRQFGDNLRVAYDIERVSDDTYFRQYNVQRHGDLRQEIDTVSTLRLRSNVNAVWKSDGTELRIDSYLFQGLRTTDNSRLTPYVLPLLSFRHDFDGEIAGGRAAVAANLTSLQRTSGVDTRRLTTEATWEREIVTRGGHKIDLFANLRGDGYRYADLNEGTETVAPNPALDTREEYRFAPTGAVSWSYPLTRRFAGAQILIEPRAQFVASPVERNPGRILNEDSQSVEFDFPGLFEYNKSPGYDVFEDGQRFNLGLTASAAYDNGVTIEASAGRQYRLQSSDAFNRASGLGGLRSDIVGELNVRYKTNVKLENRFRYNAQRNELARAESTAWFNAWRVSGYLTYVRLNEENPLVELARREEIMGNIRAKVTDNWFVSSGVRRNLVTNQYISQDFGIGYSDECATLDLIYRRDLTRDVGLAADNAFLIRFTLKGLVD